MRSVEQRIGYDLLKGLSPLVKIVNGDLGLLLNCDNSDNISTETEIISLHNAQFPCLTTMIQNQMIVVQCPYNQVDIILTRAPHISTVQ